MHFTFNDSLSFQTYFRAIDLYILEDIILKKKIKHRIYEHENKDRLKEISVFHDLLCKKYVQRYIRRKSLLILMNS